MYKVIDNYLNKEDCNKIIKVVSDKDFNWNCVDNINVNNNTDICFAHPLVMDYKLVSNHIDNLITPLMLQRKKDLNYINLEVYRAKVNLFLKSIENKKYGLHYDCENDNYYETIIYYINDNDGGTEFEDGSFIKQKSNRALIVYGKILHQSIGQTNTNKRLNININYYKK